MTEPSILERCGGVNRDDKIATVSKPKSEGASQLSYLIAGGLRLPRLVGTRCAHSTGGRTMCCRVRQTHVDGLPQRRKPLRARRTTNIAAGPVARVRS